MTKNIIIVLKRYASPSLQDDLLCYSFFHFIKKKNKLDHELYFKFGLSFPFELSPHPPARDLHYTDDYNSIQNTKNYRVVISDEYKTTSISRNFKSQLYHSLKLKIPAYVEWKPDSCLLYIMLKPETDSAQIQRKIEHLQISHSNKYIWTNRKEKLELSNTYQILTFSDMWEISKNCKTLIFINQLNNFQNELIDMNDYSEVLEIS